MSKYNRAALKIQKVVRGWLCRKALNTHSKCLEIRMKTSLPKMRKPPIYRKKPSRKWSARTDRYIIFIQKHVRGYLQRKRYKEMFIEKMLKEQEDEYRSRVLEIEKELNREETSRTGVSPSQVRREKSSNLYLELPLPMSQRRSPSKYRFHRQVIYDYDYYILAAIEIQRAFRGYLTRKRVGNFWKVRKAVIKAQRLYRDWRQNKENQLQLAGALMKKQCSILSTSFNSYQHLKSLILTQDRQGQYTKFLQTCEDQLLNSGLRSSSALDSMLKSRIQDLEQEKLEQEHFYKELLQQTRSKHKSTIRDYLKGLKGLKFAMELSQKSSFEQISKLVRGLASASRDLDTDSFYENSTFLPDVSFTDKSSINLI